jgi:choline dehydrogenase-like flavoprotein
MRRVMQLFDQAVRQAGVAHFEAAFPDEPSAWRQAVEGGKHHMGTTRMHVAPEHGVVDANSRVHGTSNLFVTGSSVFPSGGYANPTLTIVALAVRLGDHLTSLRFG